VNARQRTPEQNARVERLAKDLHRHYRAGEKALGPPWMERPRPRLGCVQQAEVLPAESRQRTTRRAIMKL
jgi:hypothetical protein